MSDLYTFDKSTVVSRLHRWGQWKMNSCNAGGYPSKSAFMRDAPIDPNSNRFFFNEIDSECIETNRAIDNLPHVPMIVIRVEYLSNHRKVSDKAIACGITKDYYYKCLKNAHELVAKELNLYLHGSGSFGINVLCG